jgi:hypothetical protein
LTRRAGVLVLYGAPGQTIRGLSLTFSLAWTGFQLHTDRMEVGCSNIFGSMSRQPAPGQVSGVIIEHS